MSQRKREKKKKSEQLKKIPSIDLREHPVLEVSGGEPGPCSQGLDSGSHASFCGPGQLLRMPLWLVSSLTAAAAG